MHPLHTVKYGWLLFVLTFWNIFVDLTFGLLCDLTWLALLHLLLLIFFMVSNSNDIGFDCYHIRQSSHIEDNVSDRFGVVQTGALN